MTRAVVLNKDDRVLVVIDEVVSRDLTVNLLDQLREKYPGVVFGALGGPGVHGVIVIPEDRTLPQELFDPIIGLEQPDDKPDISAKPE